jgi:hypothetical protein
VRGTCIAAAVQCSKLKQRPTFDDLQSRIVFERGNPKPSELESFDLLLLFVMMHYRKWGKVRHQTGVRQSIIVAEAQKADKT